MHLTDNLELGLASSQGIEARLVDGVIDVGCLADVRQLRGRLNELELLDQAGRFGYQGVAENILSCR